MEYNRTTKSSNHNSLENNYNRDNYNLPHVLAIIKPQEDTIFKTWTLLWRWIGITNWNEVQWMMDD